MTNIHTLMKQVASTGEAATASYIIGGNVAFPDTVINTTATVVSDRQPASSMPMLTPPWGRPPWEGNLTGYVPPATHSPTVSKDQTWAYVPYGDSSFCNERQSLAKIKKTLGKAWNIPSKQQKKPPKGSLELVGDENFSPGMEWLVGKANITNIYGVEDYGVEIAIFEASVESKALYEVHNESNHTLVTLLRIARRECGVNLSKGPDGELRWRIGYQNIEGTSLVDLIRHIFTISRLDALATLAGIVNISFENITRLSSVSHVAEEQGIVPLDDMIPRFLFLSRYQGVAERIKLKKIKGHSGQTVGAIALYRYGETLFGLPATVGKRTLSIGIYKPTAFWLNQHHMDAYPSATIVICQDIRAALALSEILSESRNGAELNVIVTGHLFDDLSVLPWNYFFGHDVVFVPAPNKACLAMIKLYQTYSLGVGARSFKVATHILLHSKPSRGLNIPNMAELTDYEARLVRRAVCVDDIERPVWFIKQLLDDAISCDESVRHGQESGIFKRPKQVDRIEVYAQEREHTVFDFEAVSAVAPPKNIFAVTLAKILPPGIIMIHGFKDAGKSFVVLELLRAALLGGMAFRIFAVTGSPAVADLRDSETPEDLFKFKIIENGLGKEIRKKFFPYSKVQQLRMGGKTLDLSDAKSRALVEAELVKENAAYFAIDNLTSFASPGEIYQQKIAGEILDWAGTLTAKGLGVLIVHHSNHKSEKDPIKAAMRGSQEFSIRAQTEIVVIGRKEILENADLGTEEVKAVASSSDGTVIGVHFRYCKLANVLEGHTFWFHLPQNKISAWDLLSITGRGGESLEISPSQLSQASDEGTGLGGKPNGESHPLNFGENIETVTEPPAETPDDALSKDEKKVMEYARQNGKIEIKDVRQLLDYGDTKSREILTGLVDAGLLKKIEAKQGCPTVYGLAD